MTIPSNIIGRTSQAEQIVKNIQGLSDGLLVPLISVYERSSSGKSTVVKFVCKNMNDIVCSAYVNLRKARTVFSCANRILGELGSKSLTSADGLTKAIDHIKMQIEMTLDKNNKKFFVLVLDEYDVIFYDKRNNPSDFMYKLLTLEENLRERGLWLCIITISNNALADYTLDDRVKSRMGTSEIYFNPYNKDNIVAILSDRAKKAFVKKPSKEVLEYCAQISSQSYGDARRALDLLRVAGEQSTGTITKENVDKADRLVQKDRIETIVTIASYHQKIAILAICRNLLFNEKNYTTTSAIYETYKKVLGDNGTPLSYRRIVDLLVELKNSGLLSSNTISKGREGYGTEYRLQMPPEMVAPLISREWWQNQEDVKKQGEEFEQMEKIWTKRSSRRGRRLPYSILNQYRDLLK